MGADGTTHAQRIYVAKDGAGKADLGTTPGGEPRNPKKSARAEKGESTAGYSVLWGDPEQAPCVIVCEGIETAAAVALAHMCRVDAIEIAVAAAVSATGIERFQPHPATRTLIIAADRDESDGASRRGEEAARRLGMRLRKGEVEVRIALPGAPGTSTDWLDVHHAGGPDAVVQRIAGAEPYEPCEEDRVEENRRADRADRLAQARLTYPIPALDSMRMELRHDRHDQVKLFRSVRVDDEGQDNWVPIASPIGVAARMRHVDEADTYGLRVVVQGMDDRPRHVDVRRGLIAKSAASELKEVLFNAGLRVENSGEKAVIDLLKAANPEHEIVVVSRPGWHSLGDEPIYVPPGGDAIGAPDGLTVELSVNVRPQRPAQAGSLAGWKEAVGAAIAAEDTPHWLLGILAGFAGPVVDLAGLDTCGINFSGFTSRGKTTAQRLAASAWGSPRLKEGMLRSMRSTENAVEGLAQASSGALLALDELSHIDGRAVGRLIYSIAGGVGKSRMRDNATIRRPYEWRTFAIFSGECSLEEKVRDDGGTWQAGMAVRFVDVDVTGCNRSVDAGVLEAIDGIQHNFGHAGPHFCRALIEDGLHRNPDELRERVHATARTLAGQDTDGALVRAAQPLALLSVAGGLAKVFGLIPEITSIDETVAWAWQQFLGSTDAVALDPEEQAVAHLCLWIAERWNVSIHEIGSDYALREARGWYDETTVYVPTRRIREATGGALKDREIGRVIERSGLLARRYDDRRVAVRYVPGVGRIDCYALRRDMVRPTDEAEPPELRVVGQDE